MLSWDHLPEPITIHCMKAATAALVQHPAFPCWAGAVADTAICIPITPPNTTSSPKPAFYCGFLHLATLFQVHNNAHKYPGSCWTSVSYAKKIHFLRNSLIPLNLISFQANIFVPVAHGRGQLHPLHYPLLILGAGLTAVAPSCVPTHRHTERTTTPMAWFHQAGFYQGFWPKKIVGIKATSVFQPKRWIKCQDLG